MDEQKEMHVAVENEDKSPIQFSFRQTATYNKLDNYVEHDYLSKTLNDYVDKATFLKTLSLLRTLETKINQLEEDRVAQDPAYLETMDVQTEQMCMIALNADPFALKYIRDKKYKYCKKAVSVDGMVLEYVPTNSNFTKNQLAVLYRKAIENNGCALMWIPIEYRTPDLCYRATLTTTDAIRYVPTSKEYMSVWRSILYIIPKHINLLDQYDDIYDDLKGYAYQRDYDVYKYIHNPPIEMTIDYIKRFRTKQWDLRRFDIQMPDDKKLKMKLKLMLFLKQYGFWYIA